MKKQRKEARAVKISGCNSTSYLIIKPENPKSETEQVLRDLIFDISSKFPSSLFKTIDALNIRENDPSFFKLKREINETHAELNKRIKNNDQSREKIFLVLNNFEEVEKAFRSIRDEDSCEILQPEDLEKRAEIYRGLKQIANSGERFGVHLVVVSDHVTIDRANLNFRSFCDSIVFLRSIDTLGSIHRGFYYRTESSIYKTYPCDAESNSLMTKIKSFLFK